MDIRSFHRFSKVTLAVVYFLILVGGIVRSTGSGMGCPDWPTCFGRLVPPTSVAELPENYKEVYAENRHRKNERVASYLRSLGFGQQADRIVNDGSIRTEDDFNPVKTWTEYINRLVGVTTGILVFLLFVFSLNWAKTDKKITVLALATLLLVGFQGWTGSIVVSTKLLPWTITVHMMLALGVVALLSVLVHRTDINPKGMHVPGLLPWAAVGLGIVIVQVVLGTQVREGIDGISGTVARSEWIQHVGTTFIPHRSFSWILVALYAFMAYRIYKSKVDRALPLALFAVFIGMLFSGMGMAYFSMPPFLQPLHLLLATLLFGFQFMMMLKLKTKATGINP